MENTEKPTETDEIGRNPDGTFAEGNPGGPGRPQETPEQKIIKKAIKEYITDYKEKLAEALPKIEPVLVEKAVSGDIQAIKEVNDRVMGKAPQSIDHTSAGEKIAPIYGNQSLQKEKEQPPHVGEQVSSGESTVE